ncbi:M20 aminoacylase family protein [Falsiphaeobacter marinintestinus]|uniref:M20 aminoacylase family protein n=1 Tax=Falsiphaeobacter marinintestinus TaxID=1492905 RepID=UPI0011B4C2D4|nr:M20 aminoacylase family protein [Phaeobacter marinintestinus]
MPIKNRLAELLPEIAAWRQDIHAHPELGTEEHRTAALVADKLAAFGCDEIVPGVGGTGVVGVIRGKANTSGRVIGLRGDMDALPILEASGVDYPSRNEGVMHACGHDGHTAMLLGAAKYLAETRNFDGTVVLLFQPAEEVALGAKGMIDDGVMDRFGVDEVYGIHNMPGLPVGQFAIRPGPLLAATDEFFITVGGKGGHAAEPHTSIDPTVIASHIVIALQTIISRNADPIVQGVVSVTSVDTSSHAFNVIPQSVKLRGTVRTHSADLQDLIEQRLSDVATGIAASFGGQAQVEYLRHVPITINTDENTAFAEGIARSIAGDCSEASLIMGGEDFAFMLQERPGAFIFLGNGDSASLHHPEYNFNDETIPAGCSWFAELVERRMPAA